MNWRLLFTAAIIASLALGFTPAFSQSSSSSGVAHVYVDHYFSLNSLGFGVVNDSITFRNNGTSSVQIPTIELGIPHRVSARALGFELSPDNQFSMTQAVVNGNTTFTITPDQPTLNAGSNVTVALKGLVDDDVNFSSTGFDRTAPMLVMYSPSVNMNVSIKDNLILPTDTLFTTVPPGFSLSSINGTFTKTRASVIPSANEGYLTLNATDEEYFTPIVVNSLTRSIVPSANGSPMVEDQFSIHNLATYNITQIHLNLLGDHSSLTELPSSTPPLLNPQVVDLSSGELTLADANMGSALLGQSNLTLTLEYPVPTQFMNVTGSTLAFTVPEAPLIGAPASNYTINLVSSKGIVTSGQTSFTNLSVNPLTAADVHFSYTVSVGWATTQAVPAGVFVFAIAFAMFAIQRPMSKEKEEGEKSARKTPEVLRSFEDKTGLETQYMAELAAASKGSIGKTDFERMRNEVNELRSRALQRLGDMKQGLGSGKQYDVLTRVAEAEKEEDRAFRDLLNLYMQYHGNRMNEETFKRLQPNYKKRVDSAINRLSDLLHETQTEEK